MAGTRRGRDRQEESDAFEAANPFLTRVNTTLEVERVEESPFEPNIIGPGPQNLLIPQGPEGALYPKVTQDGQDVPFSVLGLFPDSPNESFAIGIETPIGLLFATDDLDPDDGGGIFSADLTLTEDGFGVLTDGDDEDTFFTLDDDEGLVFFVGPGGPGPVPVLPFLFGGGVEFEVDYMVTGGSGMLEIVMEGFDILEDGYFIETDTSNALGAGDTGSFSGNLDNGGLFEAAGVGVTGSLEVVITGINVKTNFSGEFFDMTS